LNLDRYDAFVVAVTDTRPTADATATDCYRIGNRLEAFVAEHRRTGAWTPALVEEYPDVDSLDQIYALARFFRHCHEERLTGSRPASV
jgi:nicotinamidase-related amidase